MRGQRTATIFPIGNMFSMAGASLLLPFLPMLPPQILLNNLMYDLSQVTIPGDRVDVNYLQKPKKWSVSLIRRYMVWMGLVSSVFDFLTFGVLLWGFKAGGTCFAPAGSSNRCGDYSDGGDLFSDSGSNEA